MKIDKQELCDILDKHKGNQNKTAKEFNVSRQAVNQLINYGYNRKGTKISRNKHLIICLLNVGFNYREIADMLNINKKTISLFVKNKVKKKYILKEE